MHLLLLASLLSNLVRGFNREATESVLTVAAACCKLSKPHSVSHGFKDSPFDQSRLNFWIDQFPSIGHAIECWIIECLIFIDVLVWFKEIGAGQLPLDIA